MFKKNILTQIYKQLFVLFLLLTPSSLVFAQTNTIVGGEFLPSGIVFPAEQVGGEFSADAKQKRLFDAGKSGNVQIQPSSEALAPNTMFEYGVAREIKNSYLTNFEILSTKNVPADSVEDKFNITIPNITENESKATYVVYLKTYVPNDPDTEHFFVSKNFSIKPSGALFTNVKYINLIKSTGERYGLSEGPTIYDPVKEKDQKFATSTSLEVTFESNQETVVHPIIQFTKLRTGDFAFKFDAGEIKIKKGETYAKIPLPVFDYQPGVYVGKVDFGSNFIKTKSDLQYIVGGDMVTVGKVYYKITPEGNVFSYAIFATPVDLERLDENTKNIKEKKYDVSLVYKNGRKQVFKEQKEVDFLKESFESIIPSKISEVSNIEIIVTSKEGEVVYKGVKDVDLKNTNKSKINKIIFLWTSLIIILLAGIFFLLKLKKNKKIKIISIAILFILTGISISFAWEPVGTYILGYQNAGYANEGVYERPRLYFNENLSTTKYSYGDTLSPLFKFSYVYCNNTSHDVKVGFSTSTIQSAISSAVSKGITAATKESFGNTRGSHTIYRNTTSFTQANLGTVNYSTTDLYAYVSHNIYNNAGAVQDGWTKYKIPITILPPPPTNFTVNTSAVCSPDINLSWTASSNLTVIDGYKLYRSTTQDGTYALVATIAKTATTYTDTLTSIVGGVFYYKLVSYTTASSLESNPATATYTYSATCASGICKTPPHNTEVISQPDPVSVNLCEQGLLPVSSPVTSSVVNNRTVYGWNCIGTVEAQKATCSATLAETDPVCAVGLTFSEEPEITNNSLCTLGAADVVDYDANTNQYNWHCVNGSRTSALCTAQKQTIIPETPSVTANGRCNPSGSGQNIIDLSISSSVGSLPLTYHIYRSTVNSEDIIDYSEIGTYQKTSINDNPVFSDQNATPGATYYYKVKATNIGGSSSFSSNVSGATLLCDTDPSAVDCGSAVNDLFSSAPSASNPALCNPGSTSEVITNTNNYSWQCVSADNSATKTCSASKLGDNGGGNFPSCGSAEGVPMTSLPTNVSNMCSRGSLVENSSTDEYGGYSWQCEFNSKKVDCFSFEENFVPDNFLCEGNDCPATPGTVALRKLNAFPNIGSSKGYTCTVFLENTFSPNNYSVFESKNEETFCQFSGPSGNIGSVFSPNGDYKKTYPFLITTQSTYKLTCWQQDIEGVKTSNDVSKEVTCKINPEFVETSWVKRFFAKVNSLTASAVNSFASFFSSNR